MENVSAWIRQARTPLEVAESKKPIPGKGEVLVKVMVIAFSPIEYMIQRFETHSIPYPNILGESYSGVVESAGDAVMDLIPGDRVAVIRPLKDLKDPRFGSYQIFALASPKSVSKLPESVSLEDGATTILNLATITSALTIHMNLARPTLASPVQQRREKILIYGGSSSCGWLAISYAKAAGYSVVTTSSPKNCHLVQTLHPDKIIDHTQSPEAILHDLETVGPFEKIFDTIGLVPVTNLLTRYLESLGGSQEYHTLVPLLGGEDPYPKSVKRIFASYPQALEEEQNAELREWFFGDLLSKGLESGSIKPMRFRSLGVGLDRAQSALDMMANNGQSCEKLILYPWS